MRHHPPRLPESRYRGRVSAVFTACEEPRRGLLANGEVHSVVRECLEFACERHLCSVPAYILMPDHLHALMLGDEDESDLNRAFITFKRLSGSAFRRIDSPARWQDSYYDRVIRGDWTTQVRYLLRNPYRANLIDHGHVWLYAGAIRHDPYEIAWDIAI
ncbi:hypothetical protein EON81_15170 [bacterium]|nr:MAG: hypothetical protein EON81_15170 [bacterium]